MNIVTLIILGLCVMGTSDTAGRGQMCTFKLQIKIVIDLTYWMRSTGTENVTLKKFHLSSCKQFCLSYYIFQQFHNSF